MTTAPASRPSQSLVSSRPPAHGTPSASAAPAIATIDPLKLLKKYMWVLVFAAVFGAGLGVAGHYALMEFSPRYRAFAIFEASPPRIEIGAAPGAERTDRDELERFMQTQVQIMQSDQVLRAVAESPDVAQRAPAWANTVREADGRVNPVEGFESLKRIVRARALTNTRLVELSVNFSDPDSATYLVQRVREEYLTVLSSARVDEASRQMESLRTQIRETEDEIERLENERDNALRGDSIDSLDERGAAEAADIRNVNQAINQIRLELESLRTRSEVMQEQLDSPSDPRYADELRQMAEQAPIIQNIKSQIAAMESELRGLRRDGVGPENRGYRRLENRVESKREQIATERENQLRSLFAAQVDGTRTFIRSLEAQEADLIARRDELRERLNTITLTTKRVADLDRRIEHRLNMRTANQEQLENLEALDRFTSQYDAFDRPVYSDRITLIQRERRPDTVSFPRIHLMVPAGVVLVCGLVGGLILLRELLDQRVKGPSDITMIPRTKVLGMIPNASEDPSAPKRVETAFRDSPSGVIAEHFRHVRTPLLKRMQQAGHRSLLVLGGAPDAGATSVTINLAHACAASDLRVLIIDANFRRAGVHRAMELPERPGLADVLAGTASVTEAIFNTDTDNVSVLAVGAKEHRIYERLATEAMGSLIAQLSSSYDVVLVDTSPAIVAGDGQALANHCDASLLVVRAMSEKRGMVARVKNDLMEAKAEFMGVLVNGVRSAAGGYLKRNIRATHEYHNDRND